MAFICVSWILRYFYPSITDVLVIAKVLRDNIAVMPLPLIAREMLISHQSPSLLRFDNVSAQVKVSIKFDIEKVNFTDATVKVFNYCELHAA